MPAPDTMRPCSSWLLLLSLLLAGSLPGPAIAQAPVSGGQPAPPEKQAPLNVDRDPVAAPEGPEGVAPPATAGATIGRDNGKYTLQRNVDEVVLSASVLDDKQHLITTLGKDDFKVYEDGVAQTISSFQHQDIPISLGILVDNSGSMRTKRRRSTPLHWIWCITRTRMTRASS